MPVSICFNETRVIRMSRVNNLLECSMPLNAVLMDTSVLFFSPMYLNVTRTEVHFN